MGEFELINERRAINFFDNTKKIDKELLSKVIKLANTAPSSMNLQPWELIVVESMEYKEILKKYAFGQPKVTEASAVFIVVADPEGLENNIEKTIESYIELGYMKSEQAEHNRKNAFGLYKDKYSETRKFFAIKNTSFFAMNLMISARVYGLETHPMDGFNEEKIKIKFKIDEHKKIPLIIAIGYPKPGLQLLPRAYRKPEEEFVKYF
ncbi:MAG: nitroreductase family protein [Candidatus Muirbacterium halophilum]|nr:nitroreductase family protein [Candidatus Muirbacterium halophilum]MCK9476076.1 nitroreductase family protein [Candidatus Muirbacterium halophilum]